MDDVRPFLRWDYHPNHLQSMFSLQMEEGRFCDVTLACKGGQKLKAHRAVLCACSAYFDMVLDSETAGKETIVIIKDGQFDDIKSLIEFMYNGEVSVDQVSLARSFFIFL